MSSETVYSADSVLRSPRRFLSLVAADLAVIPPAAWRLFVRLEQSKYRQSLLRWAWLVTPALVLTVTWVFLAAAGIINHHGIRIPYAAYVGGGTVVWQLFLDALNAPSAALARATNVLKSARLPHEAWIVAGALDALVNLAVRLVLLLVLLAALGTLGGLTLLLVPLALAGTMLFGLALGTVAAVAGRLYADVAPLISVVSTIWFFITPIVYALPRHGTVRQIVELNPLTPMVLTARAWLTGTTGAQPLPMAAVSIVALLLTIASWFLYRIAQPHLVERM